MSTVSEIIDRLKNYPQYKNLSNYYIKKDIKIKYNLKVVKKENLLIELENLSSSKFTQLPKELILEIMINLDIETLKQFRLANKTIHQYCDNQLFWIKKFKNEGLPLPIISQENKDLL